ncbi:hypothetical protein JHK86_025269 [Glycine max]|nr:hypothetical protein JHK86_025269 [Glycine max]
MSTVQPQELQANPSLSLLTYNALDKLATATTIAPLIWQYYSNSNLSLNFKAYISTSINTFLATSPQGVKRAAPLECQRICFYKKSLTSFTTPGWEDTKPDVEHSFMQQLVLFHSDGFARFIPCCADVDTGKSKEELLLQLHAYQMYMPAIAHFGQLSIIFLWLSGMYFHGARFFNYEAWLSDPTRIRPSAQIGRTSGITSDLQLYCTTIVALAFAALMLFAGVQSPLFAEPLATIIAFKTSKDKEIKGVEATKEDEIDFSLWEAIRDMDANKHQKHD